MLDFQIPQGEPQGEPHSAKEAMKLQPEYLWQSRTGVYFFRARIPKQFIEHFKACEIKKSLKTDSQRLAAKLARAYRVELDKEMDKLASGVCLDDSQQNTSAKPKTSQTATKPAPAQQNSVEGKICTRDSHCKPEPTQKIELITQVDLSGIKTTFDYPDNPQLELETAVAYKNATAISSIPAPTISTPAINSILLSELADAFIQSKISAKKWDADPRSASHGLNKARLDLLIEIIGDKQTSELTWQDAIKVEETLPNVPTNKNKKPELRNLALSEQLKTDANKFPRLSKQTQSKIWELFTSLIAFGKKKHYIDKSTEIADDCEGIRFSKKESKKVTYRKFTDNDLQSLFNGYIYQEPKQPRGHDYQFWLPLLAATRSPHQRLISNQTGTRLQIPATLTRHSRLQFPSMAIRDARYVLLVP